MRDYTRKIVSAIVRGHGLKEVLRELLQDSINHLLTHELVSYLGYEAYDRNGRNINDYRNGYYYRQFNSAYGVMNIIVPRDRNGQFKQHTLPRRRSYSDSLETYSYQALQPRYNYS